MACKAAVVRAALLGTLFSVAGCERPTDCCFIPGSGARVEAELADSDGNPLERASVRPVTYQLPCESTDRQYPQLHPPDSTDANGQVELSLWVGLDAGVHCVDLVVVPLASQGRDTISLDVTYFADEILDTTRVSVSTGR